MAKEEVKFTCRGRRSAAGDKVVAELLGRGDVASAASADAANRNYCGADLTPLWAKVPEDGKEHQVKCPRKNCGMIHRFARHPAAPPESEDAATDEQLIQEAIDPKAAEDK